jgi:hypothetical protein
MGSVLGEKAFAEKTEHGTFVRSNLRKTGGQRSFSNDGNSRVAAD